MTLKGVFMKTWDEIAAKVAQVEKLCKDWESDPETPTVEFEQRETKAVSRSVDRAWSELYDFVAGGDIEPDAYRLVMAMDAWIDEVDRFRDSSTANPGGTDELWRTWDDVLKHARQRPVPKMLEGVIYLSSVQKCSPMQIAKIYEWRDEFGQPDTRRVLGVIESGEEEPTPSPHWTRERDATAALWEARQSRQRQVITEPPRVSTDPVIAPESMETLLSQNVPSRQIARMKNIDQQTVIDYARELGVIVDGQTPPPAMTPDQHLTRVRNAENERLAEARKFANQQTADTGETPDTYESLNNYREQVRQMAFDGCSKQQIVQLLKPQYPDRAKPGSVAQIISAIQREEAASQE